VVAYGHFVIGETIAMLYIYYYKCTVAYPESFHGGLSFSGIWWPFVFGVRCLWRPNLTSYLCFQTNVLAKFV